MGDNVFDQYVNLFGSFNFAWIIVVIIVFGVVMIAVSIIKYNLNVSVIKKSVKAAIRELIEEEEISLKKKEETKDTTQQ